MMDKRAGEGGKFQSRVDDMVGGGGGRRSAHVITREDSGLVRRVGVGGSVRVITREDSGLVRQRGEGRSVRVIAKEDSGLVRRGGGGREECMCDSEGRKWTGPSEVGEGGRSVRVIAREDSGLVRLQAASSRYGGNRASSDFLFALYKLYTPSRSLRSDSGTLSLQTPRTRLCTVGSRAFSVFGPSTWNDLPLPLRQKPSLGSFRSNLKTFLFPKL